MIQSVDSFKLLTEINRQAKKIDRVVNCLLQIQLPGKKQNLDSTPQNSMS